MEQERKMKDDSRGQKSETENLLACHAADSTEEKAGQGERRKEMRKFT